MNEPMEENTAECLTSSKRKRKLSNLEVADFIVEKGIKSETELLVDLPIVAQNNIDLPIAIEPIVAQNSIDLPIVVELIVVQNNIDLPIVVEPIEAEGSC